MSLCSPGTARLRSTTQVEVQPHRWGMPPRAGVPSISFWRRAHASAFLPGIAVDGRRVWTSYEALQAEAAPESLIIIGAGAVGVEFASIFATYGTHVTLIEMLPTLVPLEDPDIAEVLDTIIPQTRHADHDRHQGGKSRGDSDHQVRVMVASPQGRAGAVGGSPPAGHRPSPEHRSLGLRGSFMWPWSVVSCGCMAPSRPASPTSMPSEISQGRHC